ncbi:MAG: aspartate--tRNA ligase [Clostridiales bacterium]|nr:aspartate--tRNA ligase [Clostridiales bacterium]
MKTEMLNGLKRTHMCTEVSVKNLNEEVTLMGWVQTRRDMGGIIFIDLRDRTGLVQIVFNNSISSELLEKAEKLRSEYVIAIKGIVEKRSDETINPNMKTGEIEVIVNELRILSKSEALPFQIEDGIPTNELVRLKNRCLDLRRNEMKEKLITRYKITKIARDYYDENGFLEIETPILTKSTPEGARDYLVPSRVVPGTFFALPQSPQLFKQMLMVSGYDRYIQIAKCFRDEDLRADRQPEFTQIDLEMSFVDEEDVMTLNEGFLKRVFKEILNVDIPTPFIRMPYKEAMDRFGSDKPDIRFGMELVDLSDIVKDCDFKVFSDAVARGGSVRAINAKGCGDKFSRREIDALGEFAKIYRAKGLAWISLENGEIKSAITKFLKQEEIDSILKAMDAESGDLILFAADVNDIVYDVLGNLRLEVARKLDLLNKDDYKFLWVTEFPQFEYSEEEQRLVAKHHPFTMPMNEDIPLLDTNPASVRAKAYDVVLNGVEIGGGSLRIYNSELQEKMFNLLGIDSETAHERFGFLLNAFKYGVPPHGGMAYGLDRLVMLITKTDNIKDVIAFPKLQNSSCPLTDAPSVVDYKQLRDLRIKSTAEEKK